MDLDVGLAYRAPDGQTYKVGRFQVARDGSYYVHPPLHPEHRATLTKLTFNYARDEQEVVWEDAIDLAGITNPDHRLKLTHHPSGWVQFSGRGVLSGFDQPDQPRGMAVRSWPLTRPTLGPAWGLVVRGIRSFPARTSLLGTWQIWDDQRLSAPQGWNTLTVEAFCFPPLWKRFVTVSGGKPVIRVIHPAHVVYELDVHFVDPRCRLQNFYGLNAWATTDARSPDPYFSIGSSTGNMRRNDAGDVLGDGLIAMYPPAPIEVRRDLDYGMPEVVERPPG